MFLFIRVEEYYNMGNPEGPEILIDEYGIAWKILDHNLEKNYVPVVVKIPGSYQGLYDRKGGKISVDDLRDIIKFTTVIDHMKDTVLV